MINSSKYICVTVPDGDLLNTVMLNSLIWQFHSSKEHNICQSMYKGVQGIAVRLKNMEDFIVALRRFQGFRNRPSRENSSLLQHGEASFSHVTLKNYLKMLTIKQLFASFVDVICKKAMTPQAQLVFANQIRSIITWVLNFHVWFQL